MKEDYFLAFSMVEFPSIIFCRAGFVKRYSVNLFLSWNILFYSSMYIDSFAGYIILLWHLCSIRVCIPAQDLLALIDSISLLCALGVWTIV